MRPALRWKIAIRRRSERKREGHRNGFAAAGGGVKAQPMRRKARCDPTATGPPPDEAAAAFATVQDSDLEKAERFVREREADMEQQRELVVGFRRDGGSPDEAVNRLRGLYDLVLERRKNLARLQHRERQAAPRKVAKPTPRPLLDRSVETGDRQVVFPGER